MGRMLRGAILIGCVVTPIITIGWLVVRSHNSDLEPAKAASIISSTSEFREVGSLLNVSFTDHVNGSMGEHYYADFTFREYGTGVTFEANGQFDYWSANWHLSWFQYGKYPNVKIVTIKSDVAPKEFPSIPPPTFQTPSPPCRPPRSCEPSIAKSSQTRKIEMAAETAAWLENTQKRFQFIMETNEDSGVGYTKLIEDGKLIRFPRGHAAD